MRRRANALACAIGGKLVFRLSAVRHNSIMLTKIGDADHKEQAADRLCFGTKAGSGWLVLPPSSG